MKCIFSVNTWMSNTFVKSELWTETKDGKRAPLLPIVDGIRTTLTVNENGHTLTNNDKEILRQGILTDVFAIYDSMMFPVDPLHVVSSNFVGMFEEYERIFGFGRVERTDKKRFLVHIDRSGEYVGIGITETSYHNTYAIHSLFIEGAPSNREIVNYIASFLEQKLKACEIASVTGANIEPSKIDGKYAGLVRVYSSKYKDRFEQVRLLAEDATLRRSNISEVLDQPVRYLATGIFDVEEVSAVG